MNCPSCGKETAGIKINGSLYCPLCGDPFSTPKQDSQAPETEPAPILAVPKAKLVNYSEKIEKEIDTMGAEFQVLDLIEDEAKKEEKEAEISTLQATEEVLEAIEGLPSSEREIKKANRSRIGHPINIKEETVDQKSNEPEKIKEVAETPEAEPNTQSYPFLEREEKQKIRQEKDIKGTALSNYLKSNLTPIGHKKKKNKLATSTKKILWITGTSAAILAVFVGLLLYVNLYALNPVKSKTVSENNLNFEPKEPTYLPIGFALDYVQNQSTNKVIYNYSYTGAEEKTLKIIQEKNDITSENFEKDYIKNIPGEFISFQNNGVTYWYLNERTLIYRTDFVYQIESSAKMTKEELLKIAEGMIVENNDLSD